MDTMTEEQIENMALKITETLFTNGNGDKARRLVLELEDGRNGGGWCKNAVMSIVKKSLGMPGGESPR